MRSPRSRLLSCNHEKTARGWAPPDMSLRAKHAAVVDATPVPDGWRRHPSVPSLLCNGETGRVLKIMADGSLKEAGSACGNGGRWKVGAGGRMRYRVMYEAYHPDECDPATGRLASSWEIDHINGDPSDDRLVNLQKLSKSEHSRKPKAPPRKRARPSLAAESASTEEDGIEWRSMVCMDPAFTEYEVSSDGRVRNVTSKRVLYGCAHKESGYVGVTLVRAGTCERDDASEPSRSVYVLMQRAVCWAFHGAPPSADYTVDHIDRDRGNNRASNLRWATRSEQQFNRTWTKASLVLRCSDPDRGVMSAAVTGCSERELPFATTSDAARHLKATHSLYAGLSENAIRLRIRCALARDGTLEGGIVVAAA